MAFGTATCLLTDGARTVSGTGGILDGSSGAVGAVPGSRWVVAFAGSGLSPAAAATSDWLKWQREFFSLMEKLILTKK